MKKILLFLKEDWQAYTLLVFGFILRLLYIFNFTRPENYLFSDPGGYDWRALMMAKGEFVKFSTYFPQLFHMFLSLIYRPLNWLGIIDWRIKIDVVIFAIFYIVGFWCVYQIAKKLLSKKIGLAILIILILWYPFIYLNYVVMSENLFFPLFFMGLYILTTKTKRPLNGFLIGMFWGTAFITRPILILFFPLFFLWAIFYKINWKFLVIFIVTVALVTSSMMAFNFWYTNGAEKGISSNGGAGFAMLWCDAKSAQFNNQNGNYWFAPPANENYPDSKRIFTNESFENQTYYYKMGFDCIKKHPQILYENISSVVNLFSSSLFPTPKNIFGWELLRLVFKILTGILFFISCLAISGLLCDKIIIKEENKKYFYAMGLMILSILFAAYALNVGEERYMIPYTPLLILLSASIFNIFHAK
jgi:hypothetical protein